MSPLLFLAFLFPSEDIPPIPNGCSPEFKSIVYKIETLLSESKFDEAAKLTDRLPKSKFRIQWDDSKVPEAMRAIYADFRDAAIAEWKRIRPDLDVTVGDKGDIKVSFQEVLPPPADSVMPAGATFFYSETPGEPRVEAIIALKRETPPMTIDPRHVENEVGYAIGTYMGVANFPRPIGFMGRLDLLVRLELHASKFELDSSNANLALSEALRNAAAKKTKIELKKPDMFINPVKLGHEPVSQGEPVNLSLEISNRGNAPLSLSSMVNCGCVSVKVPSIVEPGQTGLVQVSVDTTRVNGSLGKNFVIYSNDPDHPERRIDVDFWVKPAYRLLRPNGAQTVIVPKDGLKEDMYFVYDPARPIKVTSVKINGVKGIVDFAEWKGRLPDPDLKEAETDRIGYKLSVLVSPTEKKGRMPVTLSIETDKKDEVIYESSFLQWGIVALPERVYFGEVKPAGALAYFVVSRPGKQFKVTKVRTTSDLLKAQVEEQKNGEFRVTATLMGKLDPGKFQASVVVETDDPEQPTIVVPVDAFIK